MHDPAFYDWMCEKVIELGREGKSRAEMSAELDISDRTMRHWIKNFPQFGEAMEYAKTLEQAWWEGKAREAIDKSNHKFPAHLWIKSMCVRFRGEYTETRKTVLTGNDGGPIEIISTNMTPREAQELYARAMEQITYNENQHIGD